jgi:hypothetical protein
MYIAVNLQLDKILNPRSTNEQSIEEIREKLNSMYLRLCYLKNTLYN